MQISRETIVDAIKGDKKALIKLLRHEQNNIYSTLYYLKKDNLEISDLVQNILIKLSKKIYQLKNPDNFKTWLNQIVINTYYDDLRRKKKEKYKLHINKLTDDSEIEIPDNSSNPQYNILNSELDLVIKNSISNLPIRYKIPIALREIQGLSYDEISNITNTSIGTIKSRISRARNMIRNDILKYSKGEF